MPRWLRILLVVVAVWYAYLVARALVNRSKYKGVTVGTAVFFPWRYSGGFLPGGFV